MAQKQPSGGAHSKRYFENMQQIYRRTTIPMCDFNKVAKQRYKFIEIALRHGRSLVNLLHISRTTFFRNTYGGPLLLLETSRVDSVIFFLTFSQISNGPETICFTAWIYRLYFFYRCIELLLCLFLDFFTKYFRRY